MLEIKGKVNTAICYATVIEEEAILQIRRMCDYEFTSGSKVRIMPDVHAGKGWKNYRIIIWSFPISHWMMEHLLLCLPCLEMMKKIEFQKVHKVFDISNIMR